MSVYSFDKLESHFSLLERCLNAELRPTGYTFYIKSNLNASVPSLFLEIDLPIQSSSLRITTSLTLDFPKKAPRLYLQNSALFSRVDPTTREINYDELYVWRDSQARISELLRALEIYFRSNIGREKLEGKFIDDFPLNQLKKEINRLKKIEINSFFGSIPSDQLQALKDPQNAEKMIRSAPVFKEVFKKMSELQTDTIKQVSDILQKDSEATLFLENSRHEINQYEKLKAQYRERCNKYAKVREKFSENNINQFLQRSIREEKEAIELLQADIQQQRLGVLEKVEELFQKNQLLNFYQNLLQILK